MSFRRTSFRPLPLATVHSALRFRQTLNGSPRTIQVEILSSFFSYSCKRLRPQLLSFDTHANAPGGMGTSNQRPFLSRSVSLAGLLLFPFFKFQKENKNEHRNR